MDEIFLKPRVSEQTYDLAEKSRVYVFIVDSKSTKLQIRKAVENQFKVTVDNVNVTMVKGKKKNSSRKGKQPLKGSRSDFKKAFVRLKSGDKIKVFGESQ